MSRLGIMLELVFGLLYTKEGNEKYIDLVKSLEKLRALLNQEKEKFLTRAKEFTQLYKDEKIIYTMGSGTSFGVAYWFAI
jgi:fructoselysine 6-phosphate deglycase